MIVIEGHRAEKSDCLTKTQDSAKLEIWCIESDTCPVLQDIKWGHF